MRSGRMCPLFLSFVVFVCGLSAQDVVRCPDQKLPLSDRWKWALREGRRSIQENGLWIGYSIRRMMNENSFISSGNLSSGSEETKRTLNDVVSGDTSWRTGSKSNPRRSERNDVFKVLKDVAILVRVSGDPDADRSLQKVEISNVDIHFNLQNKSLLWLGEADDDQSVGLLTGLFERYTSNEIKKNLVMAVGIHQNSGKVVPFLASVLKSNQDDEIRSQAAFWLGQQNNAECLPVLFEAAQHDHSAKVKEQSVFALSQLSSEESTEALMTLVRKSSDSKIRSKAAYWLGQKASSKALAALESILNDDETTEVQRHALYALARIHTAEGVERLIKIAQTHTNPRIRKLAIQCLGQSDDPRALDALIAIVRN
jgi:hypothetical protein